MIWWMLYFLFVMFYGVMGNLTEDEYDRPWLGLRIMIRLFWPYFLVKILRKQMEYAKDMHNFKSQMQRGAPLTIKYDEKGRGYIDEDTKEE